MRIGYPQSRMWTRLQWFKGGGLRSLVTNIYLSTPIGTGMSYPGASRGNKKHVDLSRSNLHRPKVTTLDHELSALIARITKQLTALHLAAETAYMMPKHVGKSSEELLEEARSHLHLITHMAELSVKMLESLERLHTCLSRSYWDRGSGEKVGKGRHGVHVLGSSTRPDMSRSEKDAVGSSGGLETSGIEGTEPGLHLFVFRHVRLYLSAHFSIKELQNKLKAVKAERKALENRIAPLLSKGNVQIVDIGKYRV
ncbi:uncharacterized protein EV422DRAFT_503585 [Fimicolochytrium jonesii]|uniref:uncharacterized protein n=1 Tax=Fimicolochytrium jonesii TaxID=1396493 RepID=UPI0022FE8A76|nr:uncharacterized protein EV422DRAFT_503585 [Fimicolochytrium jonesii]KAI8826303.1 hypothetical protein EV422DRAFT_503585 [Fimicolochytrium jonesii]